MEKSGGKRWAAGIALLSERSSRGKAGLRTYSACRISTHRPASVLPVSVSVGLNSNGRKVRFG